MDAIFKVGDVKFSVNSSDKDTVRDIADHYMDFRSTGPADVFFKAELGSYEAPPAPWTEEIPRVGEFKKKGRNLYLTMIDGTTAVFDTTFSNIRCFTKYRSGVYFRSLLPECLLTFILSRRGGILLHASGVRRGNKGYIFVAPSGGGKSSIARLMRNEELLNDDRVIIRPYKRGFKVYGNPWHGDVKKTSAGQAGLSAIFFLKKGKGNRITPIRRNAAAMKLLANSICLSKGLQMRQLLKACGRIAASMPSYIFCFNNTKNSRVYWERFTHL